MRRRLGWGVVLALSVAATVIATGYASRLEIDTRLVNLLPRNLRAADDYARFVTVFGGAEKIYIVVTGEDPTDPEVLIDAVELLSRELLKSEWISSVRSGYDDSDEAFLRDYVLPRALLLVERRPGDGLKRRLEPEAIQGRVSLMRARLVGPTGSLERGLMTADPLGFSGLLQRPGAGHASVAPDPLSGTFLSSTGDAALVIATPSSAAIDSEAGQALVRVLEAAYERARGESGSRLEFHAVGGPLYAAQDERIIRSDLVRTVTGSAIAISLLLLLYFMGLRVPLALFLAVSAGVLWTAAVTALVHGSVSVIGACAAVMLLGLGVDYGIHGAARFQQCRIDGVDATHAMLRSFREAGPAIAASAATTLGAFLVLSLSGFRPVREMGQIVAIGIVSILATSIGLGATMVVLWPSSLARGAVRPGSGAVWRYVGRIVDGLVHLGHAFPRGTLVVTLALTAAATLGISRLEFSADFRSLRPNTHPAEVAEAILADKFLLGLDTFTVVARGPSLGEALGQAARVKTVLMQGLGSEASVTSPSDFLLAPELLKSRLDAWSGEQLTHAVELTKQELERQGFRLRAFLPALSVLESIGNGQAPPDIPREAWPGWLQESIRTGATGTSVAVAVHTPQGRWPDGPPAEVIAAIREEDPRAAVASVPLLGLELRRFLVSESRTLGGWCVLAIAVVILISFRGGIRSTILALLPVALGSYLLLGFCGVAGIVMAPLSIIVAPVLLGIGVDDGLHALHGARVHGGLIPAVKRVGRPMLMTTLTTCVAFGSLVLSRVPALRSAGLSVAAGTLLCLVATLSLLPALDTLARNRAPRGDA